jgi:hypothetical protein
VTSDDLPQASMNGIEGGAHDGPREDSLLASRSNRRRADDPGRFLARSRLAFVAIVAMLLQAFAPLPQDTLREAPRGGVPGWAIGHLCLADGVRNSLPGKTPDDGGPVKQQPLCPVCIGLQLAGADIPPRATELAPPGRTNGIRFADWRLVAPAAAHRSIPQPRAPPQIA